MDIIHSGSNMIENITENRDKNTILSLKSTNTYHNSSYNNITYLLSKEDNLIRIENKLRFNKDKVDYDFFNQANIDILASNIDKFKVAYKNGKRINVFKRNNKNTKEYSSCILESYTDSLKGKQ